MNDFIDSRGDNFSIPLVFCPQNELIEQTAELLRESHFENFGFLGAQDLSVGYPPNLTYVILGHSSRRWSDIGETNEIVNEKIKRAIEEELIPIVCIGEKEKESDVEDFIEKQLRRTFAELTNEQIKRCIIAYEPVWAITTENNSEADSPEEAVKRINYIKNLLIKNWDMKTDDLPLLIYGGSVNSENIVSFIVHEEIGGALIGKASSEKEEFIRIFSVATNYKDNN